MLFRVLIAVSCPCWPECLCPLADFLTGLAMWFTQFGGVGVRGSSTTIH